MPLIGYNPVLRISMGIMRSGHYAAGGDYVAGFPTLSIITPST